MHTAILLLGSNIGNRLSNFNTAIHYINTEVGQVTESSSVYKTDAWGNEEQDYFYNQVIIVETGLSPFALLDSLLLIEKKLGRVRIEKWGARIIDIDILFYDDVVIMKENLKIPHPLLHTRMFTLMPLAEIKPYLVHSELKITIDELLRACKDNLQVAKIN